MRKTADSAKKNEERRSDMFLWESLDHLKNAYGKYLDAKEIDRIEAEIKRSGQFKKRLDLSDEENMSCLYNLIDAYIMKKIENKLRSINNQQDNAIFHAEQ